MSVLFSELETQMCSFEQDNLVGSPDRVDALVYSLSELMLAGREFVRGMVIPQLTDACWAACLFLGVSVSVPLAVSWMLPLTPTLSASPPTPSYVGDSV